MLTENEKQQLENLKKKLAEMKEEVLVLNRNYTLSKWTPMQYHHERILKKHENDIQFTEMQIRNLERFNDGK